MNLYVAKTIIHVLVIISLYSDSVYLNEDLEESADLSQSHDETVSSCIESWDEETHCAFDEAGYVDQKDSTQDPEGHVISDANVDDDLTCFNL